ncbi:MAG: M28 family metallopeptidase [Bacteroidales bacterium]|jgi:Zn-dependent M28 family amino/carboxypeptidase
MTTNYHSLYLLIVLFIVSCNPESDRLEPAISSINADDMKSFISVLASDEFLGRAPSSLGEEKTINYLAEQFKRIGLKPGNGDSYFQEVSLIKITSDQSMKMKISGGKRDYDLVFSEDFVGGTPQVSDNIEVPNSEIIFVGYGINAPEYKWNDYEGLDVKGKTVLMLVNDPGYATSDTSLFEGRSMTMYGRWTYKFDEAARQGAKAAIIIHETGAAAYPWGVVQNSWTGSKLYLEGNMLLKTDLQMQSWITTECAKKLFESAGLDYDKTISSAAKRGFEPVKMNMTASVKFKNNVEYSKSNNVAAVWPGKEKADEYLIYTAHWDHFGVNPAFEGDSILNGAVDNATGTAALLEIAEAFTKLAKQQDRSILFLAVTCEEQGLLGSEFYTLHPLFPLDKTVGVINMDGLNILGRTKDMTIIGMGKSVLDKYALSVLEKHGRYASPDPKPEKGGYFRSDHLSFAKIGIPSLYLSKGVDDLEHGKEWGLAQSEKWIPEHYHKPSDNYEPDRWNFDGMIEDIKVFFEVGYIISQKQ